MQPTKDDKDMKTVKEINKNMSSCLANLNAEPQKNQLEVFSMKDY